MSGQQQPPKPPAPTLKKEEGQKKISKTELERRVNFVADVLRRVYANNRADIRAVNLPVTSRGALQQQAVRNYLRQPENRELLNNIYDRRTSVVAGTAENVAIGINPIVYPQLFIPIQQQQQEQRQAREREEAEADIERITSILEQEEEPSAQFIRAGRIQEQPSRPVSGRQPERGVRREVGLFDIGEAQQLELQSRRRERQSRPRLPRIERPVVTQIQRMEKRINNENQNATGIVDPVSANVPADPEQQILQEAQQGHPPLPALSNNQATINAFVNEAPEALRPSVRGLIQGNVNADTVTDDVLAYVLNRATGLPAEISKPYITALLDTFGLRVNELTRAGRIPVELSQRLTQYVQVPEYEQIRTEIDRQMQNIYDASRNLPLQFRNAIRRLSTLDSVIIEPGPETEQQEIEAYNQYEQRLRGYQQRLLREVQNNNANAVAGILNEMTGFYNGIYEAGILTSQDFRQGRATGFTDELATGGMGRLASSITPVERRREQVREIFRTSTGDELQRRMRGLYQDITDEIAGLPNDVLSEDASRESAINNIFESITQETAKLGQQVEPEPISEQLVKEARERTQTARARAEAVRAGQTGAVAGAGVGAGVVGIGEVAAGILGSSVGAGTAGLVGGGLAGAGASMAAQRMGAGRAGQLGASVAGGLLAGGAVLAGRKGDIHVPGVSVREEPIAIPQQVVQQEEESKGKGTVRPKFIIPSASILDQTESQIQADMDEFAAFDYVIPTSEGTEGNIKNNPLKQQAGIEYRLRFDGAGVDITSLWGEPLRTSESELKSCFNSSGDVLNGSPHKEVTSTPAPSNLNLYSTPACCFNGLFLILPSVPSLVGIT